IDLEEDPAPVAVIRERQRASRRPFELLEWAVDAPQLDPERRSDVERAVHPDRAAHRLDQPFRERESHARPLDGAELLAEAVERLEQPGLVLWRDPVAGVGDGHADAIRSGDDGADDDRAALPVVLDRVREEV